MATLYKRGPCWYLNFTENGQRQRKSLGAVTEAEAEAACVAAERRGLQPAAGPVFGEWAVEYAQWHSEEYPDSYFRVEQILRSHLIPYFGHFPIGAITKQDVEQYKRSRTASSGSVTKELRTLQAMLNKAVEWEVIPMNRAKGVKPPRDVRSREPRWYTVDELQRIYEADPLHKYIWRLLVNTGLRRSEAQQLRWRDVGKEALRIVSEPGARTKSAKWRLVPITPGAQEALDAFSQRGAFVLPAMTGPSLSRAFARTIHRIGLDGNLHCTRHTYCAHLVMRGVALRAIQVLAGHSTIRVTEQYAHLAPDYLLDVTKGMSL